MQTILVVEDEPTTGMLFQMLFEAEGYRVLYASTTDAALQHLAGESPGILVSDWCVNGSLTPAQVARRAREAEPSLRIAFVTGHAPDEVKRELNGLEPYVLYRKPVDIDELVEWVASDDAGTSPSITRS